MMNQLLAEFPQIFPNASELYALPPYTQVLFVCIYFYILYRAAEWIGEGSEHLLDIYGPGIVGGLIIPILGAVPEGAITFFSGLGSCAQSTVDIGMGTLAGSTIMLLTLPFTLSMLVAFKDIDETTGETVPDDEEINDDEHEDNEENEDGGELSQQNGRNKCFSLTRSGVTVLEENTTSAKWMMLTSIGFVVPLVQAIIQYHLHWMKPKQIRSEWAILTSACLSFSIFICYSACSLSNNSDDNNNNSNEGQRRQTEAETENNNMNLMIVTEPTETTSLMAGVVATTTRRTPLDQQLDQQEHQDRMSILEVTPDYLSFGDGLMDKDERRERQKQLEQQQQVIGEETDKDEENDDEESKKLTNDEKFWWGMVYVFAGSVVTILFSDAMVAAIDAFSKTAGIRSFFVSFFLTPSVGNITEIYAAILFARMKTREGITASLAILYGAATMNNTFVLGVFSIMMLSRHLVFNFIAETIAILLVLVVVGVIGLKTTIRMWEGLLISLLFPLALIFIAIWDHTLDGYAPIPAHCS